MPCHANRLTLLAFYLSSGDGAVVRCGGGAAGANPVGDIVVQGRVQQTSCRRDGGIVSRSFCPRRIELLPSLRYRPVVTTG
ncbi:hypothetical protein C8Q73DRAFT_93757 [Cubamyces lactineus]|nr:hypothetical protein C8Q73DRAFT_93757 [Cubamyces lactineus]